MSTDNELVHLMVNQQPIWHGPRGERPYTIPLPHRHGDRRDTAEAREGDVVVVAHGGVINAYCGEVVGLPNEMFFLPENTSINSIIVDGDRRIVRFLNDIVHLTDPAALRGVMRPLAYTSAGSRTRTTKECPWP